MARINNNPCRLVMGLLLLGLASASWATTITVTSTSDSGAGSLRQAINDALAGDTIDFDVPLPADIELRSGFVLQKNLTIIGPGPDSLRLGGTLMAAEDRTAIKVMTGTTLAISGLAIEIMSDGALFNLGATTVRYCAFTDNSNGNQGGAIYNEGTLVVGQSTFTRNKATDPNGGGAIYSKGSLTVEDSTFAGNTGLAGGAIWSDSIAAITGSTFTANQAGGLSAGVGGAILTRFGAMAIDNSTFSGNSADSGGAISVVGPLTLTSSTLSNNHATDGADAIANFNYFQISRTIVSEACRNQGTVVSLGDNIAQSDSCVPASAPLNDRNIDPLLLPLADNGGLTQTQALQSGSPAIDGVTVNDASCSGTDQRGFARPSGPHCDIGAFERDNDPIFTNGFD
ncbi:MAG: choice-of-anchor Q domain-containing protein [Dokdonella sp.]